jgi:hypothetical protein
MVGDRVGPGGATGWPPDKPATDLGWTFHVPNTDRLWTWMRITTSVITRLHLRGPAVQHRFFECRAQVRVLSGAPETMESTLISGYLLVEARSPLPATVRRDPGRQ